MVDLASMTGFKFYFYFYGSFSVGFSMLMGGIISPIVFLFSIIPNIEKRMGRKLEFSNRYDYFPTGRIGRFYEVGLCIASEYFLSFFGKTTKNIGFFKSYALIKADFDIRTFPRREIVWSVLLMISSVIFIFLGALLYFIGA
jgi:hypothetical protein